jgi:hypothetical protein
MERAATSRSRSALMRRSAASSGVTWAGGRPEMLCTSHERGATAILRRSGRPSG